MGPNPVTATWTWLGAGGNGLGYHFNFLLFLTVALPRLSIPVAADLPPNDIGRFSLFGSQGPALFMKRAQAGVQSRKPGTKVDLEQGSP